MADPQTIRINDANDPNRLERLEKALKVSGQRFPDVMRQCADAYARYVAEHGHAPPLPFEIVTLGRRPKPAKKRS